MEKFDLPFRQVHLDFHTSEHIPDIGELFKPEEFAKTLKDAHVNSITCFARDHHGYFYYDSKLFPERIHPNLKRRNLLKEQIEACHREGIKVPIYITLQWDHFTVKSNPEWCALDEKGNIIETFKCDPGFYRVLCLNTPYREFLKKQVEEIFSTIDEVDGFFFDILFPTGCACKACRQGMREIGLDYKDNDDRLKYSKIVLDDFVKDMTEFIRGFDKNCSIFYNSSNVGPAQKDVKDYYTHFELESLPSGGWGYMHFPITMRYARNLGLDCMGMTGKFHTYWGDFHSFKNKAALEFECFNMLALNAKCSIGDQLEPSGKLSKPVYDLIGSVYSEVEKKEKWCRGAKAVVDIGVFTLEEFYKPGNTRLSPGIIGAVRMLQESGHQFDVIDSDADFAKYRLLVLPDYITVSKDFGRKLDDYITKGGCVISTFESGLDYEKTGFQVKSLGVEYLGDAPYSPDFIVPSGEIGKGLYETEYVMYIKGTKIKLLDGAVELSGVNVPYFNRTSEHFSSHQHTPSSGKHGYAGISRMGNAIYFSHPIFTQYNKNASIWCKKLFLNAVNMLLGEQLVKHNGPSTVIAALNEQRNENRYVLHILHYIPEKRSEDIFTIEDVIPLYNIDVSIKVKDEVENVSIVPDGVKLDFNMNNGRVEFTIPKVNGHSMVVVEFKK